MSDRAKGLIVTLDRDYRVDDDILPIIEAIRMIKGVVQVDVSVSNADDLMTRNQVRHEMRQKILSALKEILWDS